MSVLSFVQILRGYVIFSTVSGFVFISEGEQSVLYDHDMDEYL
jgi:hypothetical protein